MATRGRRQGSGGRRAVVAPKDTSKLDMIEVADKKTKAKVDNFDNAEGRKYRWTMTQGDTNARTGKFSVVGFPAPASSTTLSAPTRGLSKVEQIMNGEIPEYKDESNAVLTWIYLNDLVNLFPDQYVNTTGEKIVLNLYIVGPIRDIARQLRLQGIVTEAAYRADNGNTLTNFLWDKAAVQGNAKGDEAGSFDQWKTTEEYKELAKIKADEGVKLKPVVNQDDILRVMYFLQAKNDGTLYVTDVNGYNIAKFGDEPTKAVSNVFADRVLTIIKNYTEDLTDYALDISGMRSVSKPKIEVFKNVHYDAEGNIKEKAVTSYTKKILVRIDGFKMMKGDLVVDLSDKVYTDNEDALTYLFGEIDAVNKTKMFEYQYTDVVDKLSDAKAQFGSAFAAKYAKEHQKKIVTLPQF